MHSILAAPLRLMFLLMRCIPARWCGAIGAGMGRLFYVLDAKHRKTTLENLAMVFPQKPENWHRRIGRESFAEVGRTIMELPHVYMRSKASLMSRIETEGSEALDRALARGHGVTMVACHHSNWELGALMVSMLGYNAHIIYRPLNQGPLEGIVKAARERFGAQLHARTASMRWLLPALKHEGVICAMVDQHMSTGEPVPFLGHPAYTTLLPASLYCKRKTPILCAALHRIDRDFRFRFSIWEAQLSDSSDTIHIMSDVLNNFAQMIEKRPELWLWMHKRWRVEQETIDGSKVAHGTS